MTEIHQIFDEDALRMPNSWKIFLEIRVYVTPKSRTTIMDFLYLQGPRLVFADMCSTISVKLSQLVSAEDQS